MPVVSKPGSTVASTFLWIMIRSFAIGMRSDMHTSYRKSPARQPNNSSQARKTIVSSNFGLVTISTAMAMDTIMNITNINHQFATSKWCMSRVRAHVVHWTAILGLFTVLLVSLRSVDAGFEIPGELSPDPIVLEHATIHTVSSDVIPDGTLVIEKGKITKLGPADGVSVPADSKVQRMNLEGKHIYPGLIDADTTMGLIEIDSVRATNDMRETGSLNPNVRAGAAFNPDSEMIPVARAGGVLLSLTVPRGGTVSGRSSLMRMDGWTAEDMTMVPVVGMHLNWPSGPRRSWSNEESAAEQLKERSERLENIRDLFDDVRAYQQTTSHTADGHVIPFDARLDAMVPVVQGDLPLFIHANAIGQIQEAIAFGQQQKVKIIIVGGQDAPHCAELLKRHNIPVVVTGTHRLPRRRHARYDESFRVPAELQSSGVKYCLAGYARFSASLVQNLSHQAGTAAAHGLSPAEAVRAITLSAAEILGVADQVGSLSAGKEATLIVADGDILEVTTHVEQAYLAGRPIDLSNRHQRLYERWKVKYDRQKKTE